MHNVYKPCKWCMHSNYVFSFFAGEKQLECSEHNKVVKATDTCDQWGREPGADDDKEKTS